jgi:carbamoyl-phosphate synthase large subunit
VLVRPSYVLGGRAMAVVHDDADLRAYLTEAIRVSPEKPVLVDEYLADAVELDVDAVADGEDVLVGGIMEHVEPAGVHSGDSACVVPPRSLADETLARVREVVEEVAEALSAVGLLNVQLAVQGTDAEAEVYVLEANPRASRTVPFVSKATGVPIAKVAARVMAGASLADLPYDEHVPEQYSVKEVVLPFDRLPGSDPRLGPEMKSTGEVMGTAEEFGAAYAKAQHAAAGLPEGGRAVVDLPVDGLARHFEVHASEDLDRGVPEAIRAGAVDFLVSDDETALRAAVEEGLPYCSTVEATRATVAALDSGAGAAADVRPVGERPRTRRRWGVDD